MFGSMPEAGDRLQPGISLVAVPEPEKAARAFAEQVGATLAVGAGEARKAMPDAASIMAWRRARAQERAARACVLATALAAERAADDVPEALADAEPDAVWERAHLAADAAAHVALTEAAVGDEPTIDVDAERAVLGAAAVLDASRLRRVDRRREAHATLALGNAVGAGIVVIVLATITMGTAGVESLPVALAIIVAAASPLTALGIAIVRLTAAAREVRLTREALSGALRTAGARSLDEVHERREALDGWRVRRATADDASVAAAQPLANWRALAGNAPPDAVEDLLAAAVRRNEARAAAEAAVQDHVRALGELAALGDPSSCPVVVVDLTLDVDEVLELDPPVPVVLVTADRCPLTWPVEPAAPAANHAFHITKRRRRKRRGAA